MNTTSKGEIQEYAHYRPEAKDLAKPLDSSIGLWQGSSGLSETGFFE